jgi:hypothetical protein
VTAGLLTALLATAVPAAHGQDATPPARQSANPSSPATAAPPDQATTDQGHAPATQGGGADKSAAVCFQLTGHCVEGAKAPAAKSGAGSAAKDGKTAKKALNLTAPDVRTVVPAEELKEPLPSSQQVVETQDSETVSVKGDQGVPPDVPGGLGALWWAVSHPSQAWRILTPAE